MSAKDIPNIIEGHLLKNAKRAGVTSEEVETLAKLRERTCNGCTSNGNPTLYQGKCLACGCDMEAKWRALNATCIQGKW
jgi:hypothetical protein